ncbi:MAG: adenylate kinase family protein [Thermoplasmata archaeon]|nr:adenylate kinase family protein [Thermoplasmata archaeon]
MDIAITGTPGTGKTALGEELSRRGHTVLSVRDLALEHECALADGEELEVDVSSLAAKLHGHTIGLREPVFIEGHLSHLLPADMVIVLRLSPSILKERLGPRGYGEEKLHENLEAEGVGVCLSEAVETGLPVAEIDVDSMSKDALATLVLELVNRCRGSEALDPYVPGSVDWLEEVSGWY